MPEPAIMIDRPPPAWWRIGPGLWLASVLILITAYLAFNLPGSWFGGGATQNYPGAAMAIAAGIGQAEGSKLVITSPDSKNAVILALITPRIPTLEYGLITLDVDGMPDDADVMLFWRNDFAPNKMFTRSLTVAGGHVQDAMLAGDSNWLGRVHTVGLIVRGPLARPLTINGLALRPASAATMLAERWRDWVDWEHWTGISLTRVIGGRAGMDLPLPLLTGLAVVLACGGYWVLSRWRHWPSSALTIAAMLMCGWLVLDIRWQWNLGLDAWASWNGLFRKRPVVKTGRGCRCGVRKNCHRCSSVADTGRAPFYFCPGSGRSRTARLSAAPGPGLLRHYTSVVAITHAVQGRRLDAGSPQDRRPLFARSEGIPVG